MQDFEMEARWLTAHGLRPSYGRACLCSLTGLRFRYDACQCYTGYALDHGRLYKAPGLVALASHPYHIDDAARERLEAFGSLYGVRVRIEPPEMETSWYYPGSTWLITAIRPK